MDPRDSDIFTAGGSQGWVGDPINAQNGAFSYNYVDLKVDTPAGPLQFQRHYESQFTGLYTGTLGYGWANNQDIRLIRPTDPGGEAGGIWFKGPGGNQYWFEGDATTAYTATAGVMATLTYSASGSPTYTLVDSAQSTYEFDANGRLTTWRDSLGRTFSYAYSSGLLSQISEPISGHSLSFTYDPGVPGRLQSVSDDTGRSVSYGYSGTTGDLTSVTDVRGQTWTYVYSGTTHLLTEVRDPDDTATPTLKVDYDAQGRAFREWDGTGKKIVEITFNADGTSTVVDGNGSTQTITPSNQKLLGSVAKPLGSTIQMAYDDNLKPILITDPNGSQTALTWEGSGKNVNLTRVENDIVEINSSLKQHVSFGYDSLNNPTTIVDARGFTTTLGYSGTLLTSQTDALNRTSQFTYTDGSGSEPAGLLKTVQDPLGLTTVYTYNAAGELITVSDPLGLTRAFTYDGLGRLATETGVDQLTNKYEYNAAGQVVTTTQNYLAGQGQNYQNLYNLITVNAYDSVGRLYRTTDTLGRSNWTCYDNANRVTKTVQNASGAAPCDSGYTPSSDSAYDRITVYTYDDAGNLIASTDPAGRITRTYYDALHRPTVIVQNLQGQAISVATPPSYNPANPDQNVRTTTTYDAAGHVLSTADNAGTLTQLCYDVIGRAVKSVQNATVSDPCGSYTASGAADRDLTSQSVYDANGNVIASVDTQGRITRTYYDALNRPEIVVSNLTGQAIEVTTPPTYNSAYPDRNLGTRTYYDEAGRAYRSQDLPTGQSAWTCFDNAGRVTKTVQNATGNPCGSFTPSTDPDKDIVTELRYDSLGRQIATIDPLGRITRTYYDAAGRMTATVQNLTGQSIDVGTPPAYDPAYPDRNVRFETTYDVLGRATTSVYGAGSAQAQATRMCYDALGRTVKTVTNPTVSDPCGSFTPAAQTDRDIVQQTVYDAGGLAVASIDALGHIARTYYDGLGRPVVMVSNLVGQAISVSTPPTYNSAYPDRNVRQAVSYDAAGRTQDTTNNGGLVARQDYDLAGRVVTTTVNYVSGGAVDTVTNLRTVSTFDKGGNVIRSTDPKGVVTAFDYDGQGRAIQVIQNFLSPLARTNDQNVPTTYTFDSRGNRLTITDAMTHTTTLGYDLLGRPTTETDALSHTWTTVYNKLGQRVSMTDAKGQTVSFTYDGVGRLTLIDYPAGTADVTFTYDALGNQVGMADGTGATSWAYDLTARPITITAPSGAVGYGYDRLGNRTQLRYPDTKAVTYTVDALNRIATVQDWASAYTSYTYNAAGQVVTTTLPNGVRTVYGYDAAQRLQSLAHSTTAQTLGAYTYTVNAVGNRTAVTETQAALEATAASPDRFDTIYADGFEAGGLTGWTSQSGTGLSVSSTAALAGGLGYSVAITSTTARYVQSALPTAEKHYRARFLFDPNTITMTSGTAHFLFRGYVGASTDVVQVEFRRNGAAYELRAGGRNDASAYTYTPWTVITDAAHAVELDWQAATAAGANNGSVALWIDQVAAGSATTLDNDTRAIDTARLGAVAGLDTGTTGTLYFDAFEDRRVPTVIGAETSLPDRLFTNSFESNSLANWVVYGPGITTTTAANLAPGQSIGAAVAVTSTQTTRYLEDLTPNRESRYRARVYFDPNGLTMAVNNSFNLLNIYTGTTEIGRLEFQYVATGYRLRGAVRNDASAYTYTGWTTLADSAHVLEIDWRAATGPGANDGGLTLWIDGTQVGALSGVDNDTRRVDRARIGAVGLDAGTTGTFYLDAFESRRASAIGPVQVAGSALTTTAIAYGYDPLYRLTSASYSDGTLFGYAYDAVGNVLTKTQTISGTPATQTYAYDDANRQTSAAGLAQTYDNNGNLTHDGTTAYTWDGANRMTASGSTAYTYNGLNDRVSAGGVTHQLDLNVGLTQVLADGTNTYLYGAGRLGEQQGVAWQYHLADGLGSVRQLADASGALSAARSYEPYGEVLGSAGAASSTYGFTGEQQEASGKLVYLRARYYQAETMRFASRDTWAGVARDPISLNKWVYGAASPIVYMDPSGNCYVPRDLLASALRFFESPMFGMCKAVKATTSQPTPARPTTATPGTATPAAPTPTATPTVRPTGTGTASPAASPTVRPTSNVTPGFTSTPRPHGFGDIFCPNDVFASSSAIRKAGISLSEEYLNVLSLLVYWESSKGNTPLAYSEMKIWSLLNRINDYWDQPSRSVASIWIGAEGLLIEQTLGIPSPTDDPIATWASLVADEPYWRAEPGYQDIRDAVDRIYPQWRSQGSNSVLDPTHGATAFNDIVDCRNVEPGFVCMHLVDRTSYDAVYAYRQERIQFWRDRQRDQPELNVIISGIYVITTLDGMPVYNFTIFGGCPDYPKNLYCLKS